MFEKAVSLYGPKNGPKFRKRQKMATIVPPFFLVLLTKIWDHQNVTFASENGQTSESQGKYENSKMVRGTLSTTAMLKFVCKKTLNRREKNAIL